MYIKIFYSYSQAEAFGSFSESSGEWAKKYFDNLLLNSFESFRNKLLVSIIIKLNSFAAFL